MKRKVWIFSAIILGMLVCLLVVGWFAAPLWEKLGLEVVCIQGSWPNLQIVECPQPTRAAIAVKPMPLPTLSEQGRIPIIVDDDGSPDGIIALLYFLRNPLFDVQAVTVSYGEAHPQIFARHLAQLLAGLGRGDIPVGAGRDTPLEGNNAFPEPWRASSDEFWGIDLPQTKGSTLIVPAAELMIETIARSTQPVVVFVSGSHTNLAEALRMDPSIADNIRDVYVMGGAIHVAGNIESDWPSVHNQVAEWNIWVDPVAAKEVFEAELSLHLIPLDATRQVLWTESELSEWESFSSREGVLAGKLLQWMLQSWSSEGVYIWDLVAAVQATHSALCPETELAVEVVTSRGSEQGRTVITDKAANVFVCLHPVPDQVKALAASVLAADLPPETGREFLSYEELVDGFQAISPVDESALAMPVNAAPAQHLFEGRLEFLGEKDGGQVQTLRGELDPEMRYLPEFDFEFVQDDGYLIPVRRCQIITEHPQWNYILEPGRAWQEPGDGGYARASIPFALVVKGGNAAFNGTMTFLYDEDTVSKVWYQITQETTTYTRANLWGLLEAVYHAGPVDGTEQIRADFKAELAARTPVKPIQALAEDYPGVDVSAFGRGVTLEHMTWYSVVVDGVNYLGRCQTRFGIYPYCESMRATSYSTAKSAFVSLALMRLAQKYDPEIGNFLIKDYVSEYASSSGDWEAVTFNHTIDMSTGNYISAGYMVDDNGDKMGQFFAAQPYAERIKAAFDSPHAADPGTRWVYRTSDTFILTRALQNYLQTRQGPDAEIFEFVVDEVYRPLGIGPGAYTSMRTADDNWSGQAEGGYGLWWIPDDIAKIAMLLNNDGGKIRGEQILHPDMLVAALQQNPDDRGVKIDNQRMYNNAFWANRYTRADGFDCEFWVTQMLGVSGNVVALFPNGITYYYFSDNQEFTWDAALREADKMIPLCP
jgi:inosine-uridine nucleoside N-ribohydrolase/CubicO group peptidase (beta-lactamase class C family)